jgi:hypothetical protein
VLIPNNGFDGGNIPLICLPIMLGLFPSGLKINLGLWSGFLHYDFMFNFIPLSLVFLAIIIGTSLVLGLKLLPKI